MPNQPPRRTGLAAVLSCAALAFALLLPAAGVRAAPPDGSPADTLETLPGFKVELVAKAEKADGVSWISLGKDNKGRLLLGGQNKQPLTRLTVKDGQVVKRETLKLPVTEIMGTLYAFDSLYVDGSAGGKFGLYRLQDTKGDGNYDKVDLLREWKGGGGEHGAHGIVLGPDKKHLYVVCGNFVGLPDDLLPTSPHRNYADDRVLPRAEDGNGFGAGKKPPGGFICRMDPDGKNAELFASGQRNTYDIAFNADGELFGYDSDMEWDWGTPWYRPTRAFHAVSGADHGFREGSAKWPGYYEDSLPTVTDIGVGCPTGVGFGYGAKFPAKYQKAFYMLDWTYGRVIAVHLQPEGATYTATWENLVAPKSLTGKGAKTQNNVTDIVVGDDGALYFSTGGRNTVAQLYRVTYAGPEPTAPVDGHDAAGAEARDLRHQLEKYQGLADERAVPAAWPHLGSPDRAIRYAARLAIESQPVNLWKDKALAESNPQSALTALLALARLGGKDAQADVFKALAKFPAASLADPLKLQKLRVIEVAISRNGKPADEQAKQVVAELNPLYPAATADLNRELSQVLLALNAPDAVAKTVKLLAAAQTQEEQVGYVLFLRTVTDGWTPELRREYFGWFAKDHKQGTHTDEVTKWFTDAGRPVDNGSSFNNFVKNFHAEATKTLTPPEAQALAEVLAAYVPPGQKPKKPAKPREVVKQWKMEDVEPALAGATKGRSFDKGKAAYEAAQCAACHKFGPDGGAIGPDLTAVASRFSRRDILESVIDPSKVVSEQYQNIDVKTKDGDIVTGRLLEETADKLVLMPNGLAPDTKVTVKKADVASRKPSKLSPMPDGLANVLTKDEILDLIAYMESGGKKDFPAFQK